mgnify:CR=1 FL=1
MCQAQPEVDPAWRLGGIEGGLGLFDVGNHEVAVDKAQGIDQQLGVAKARQFAHGLAAPAEGFAIFIGRR